MKIGIMLRGIGDQTDAPGIIILNLLDKMLEMDSINEYVLFYRNRSYIERYSGYKNVKSVLVSAPNKLLWDQVAVPFAIKKEKIDLLFHPKHSIPLLAGCKTLMHLRGPEYWVFPEHFEKSDLLYQKIMLPIFCRKATHLIAESNYAMKDFQKFLRIPAHKMTMIYLAPDERFKIISDKEQLAYIIKKYNLPSEFFLTVTRIIQGKKYYDGKNLVNSIKAFQQCKAREKFKFVIVGKQTKKFLEGFHIPREVQDNIIALDFVPQEELPEIYNLAKFFLFPSKYESFGIPILEAMACGCPVITSTDFSCPEIVGAAGILVDPRNVSDIASAIDRLSFDTGLCENIRKEGLERIENFSWRQAAKKTLKVIKNLT